MRTEAQNKLDAVVAFLFLLGWMAGIVVAKSAGLKIVAICFFPYAYYAIWENLQQVLK